MRAHLWGECTPLRFLVAVFTSILDPFWVYFCLVYIDFLDIDVVWSTLSKLHPLHLDLLDTDGLIVTGLINCMFIFSLLIFLWNNCGLLSIFGKYYTAYTYSIHLFCFLHIHFCVCSSLVFLCLNLLFYINKLLLCKTVQFFFSSSEVHGTSVTLQPHGIVPKFLSKYGVKSGLVRWDYDLFNCHCYHFSSSL